MTSISRRLLALALLAAPAALAAQQRVMSFEDVSRLIASGAPGDRILSLAQIDCIDFPVDVRAQQRLSALGARAEFIQRLESVCFKGATFAVKSDPEGATVLVNGDTVGITPFEARWAPGKNVRISAILSGATQTATTDVQGGYAYEVSFALPHDTIAHPSVRSFDQIVSELGVVSRYGDRPVEPLAPEAPRKAGAFKHSFWTGTLLGGAMAGAAQAMCNPSKVAPANGYANGQFVEKGTSYKAGLQPACVYALSGAGVLGGGVAGTLMAGMKNRGRTKSYNAAVARYPIAKANWEKAVAERDAKVGADSEVVAARNGDVLKVASVKQENGRIMARNAALPKPAVICAPTDPSLPPCPSAVVAQAPAAVVAAAAPKVEKDTMSILTDSVDTEVPRTGLVNPKAIAVVIGNARYNKRDIASVEYAINDANTMRKYLVSTFGFKEENIIFQENASYSTFLRLFGSRGNEKGELFYRVEPDSSSDVFVFYSGHGAPDPSTGKAFFVPSDADPNLMSLTGYAVDVLYENLSKIPAKSVTVAVDACFSGTSERGLIFKGISPVLTVDNPVLGAPNALLFTASEAKQVSSWYEEKKHGLFTYFFLKGIRERVLNPVPRAPVVASADSAAPVVPTLRNILTAKELGEYVRQNVARQARMKQREQYPQVYGLNLDRPVISVPLTQEPK